jgi:hypothetical protein
MAPRVSRGKTPAQATLIHAGAAASAAVAPLSDNEELGDAFHELYNDLLVLKDDLIATEPGSARKRLTGELGEALVCSQYYIVL